MSNSVYKVNKGINKPIEFRGLKAQYIWWLGGGQRLSLALLDVRLRRFTSLHLSADQAVGDVVLVNVAHVGDGFAADPL